MGGVSSVVDRREQPRGRRAVAWLSLSDSGSLECSGPGAQDGPVLLRAAVAPCSGPRGGDGLGRCGGDGDRGLAL